MMDENTNSQLPENQEQEIQQEETAAETENISVTDAITGVISDPSDTFTTIRATPKKHYWVLPYVILAIASLISTFLFYQDEQLIGNLVDVQREKIRESIEKSVEKGDMTREQGNQAIETAEKFSDPRKPLMKIIGFVSALLVPVIFGLLLSLVYLIVLKIMKAEFDYINIINVLGLSSTVLAVGSILSIVLSIVLGKLSSVSLSLVLTESVAGKFLHTLVSKFDVFSIWYFILVAIGISKIAKIKSSTAYSIVLGVWIIYIIITTVLTSAF